MLKDFARSGVNTVRRVKSRLEYESRISDVPTMEINETKNILIITVDCLRNDRISRTGYKRTTTPFIDSLDSFTPAIAAAPWTFSSVPSILTGLYPHHHGAAYTDDSARNQDLNNPPNGVADEVYTLAELLAVNGYKTWFSTAIETAAIPMSGRFRTVQRQHDVAAETLLSDIQEWWNNEAGQKFGYVQLGDLHEPLHKPDTACFGEIPDISGIDRWRFQSGDIDEDDFEQYRNGRILLYDTLVRYVDEQIEHLVSNLQDLDDTILVITSDHGEEFWEYKDFEENYFDDPRGISGVGHGHALVPPILEIPIATNIGHLSDQDTRVSSTDIVPTLLQEIGIDTDLNFDGSPLQTPSQRNPVLSEEIAHGPNQISVTQGDDHLIYVPANDQSILINFETGDIMNDSQIEDELRKSIPNTQTTGATVEISEDVQEQLSDLGYAE